jgi:hypothetical protein
MSDMFALTVGNDGVFHAGNASDDLVPGEETTPVSAPPRGLDPEDNELRSPVFDPHRCRALAECDSWDLHGPDRVESSGRKPRDRK